MTHGTVLTLLLHTSVPRHACSMVHFMKEKKKYVDLNLLFDVLEFSVSLFLSFNLLHLHFLEAIQKDFSPGKSVFM